MKNKIVFYLLIILLLFMGMLEGEAYRYDPELSWKVLESPHFSIYFFDKPENQSNVNYSQSSESDNDYQFISLEQLAQQIAELAEETLAQINEQIILPPHHHMQKIAIILEDFTDYTLGYANSFPHRVIRLALTAPTAKSFDMKFKSWFKMVLAHEYTHIAHFEMTGGITTALRAFFGQIISPNALQPTWAIEGLAVYNETKFNSSLEETGGRGIDPRYDMYLRLATLENHLNTLDQISGYYLISWPGGNAPYIYGQSIIHFIAQIYGEEKMIEISEVFCRYPYLGFNYAFKKVLGIDLDKLFQNWKADLQEKYQTQKKKITAAHELTKSQQLTDYHYWVDYPRWIPFSLEGPGKIAVRVSSPHSYPFIQIIDPSFISTPLVLSSSIIKKQSIIKRNYGRDSSFSISPDGNKIIYAKLPEDNPYYEYFDLYLYDLKDEKEIRLSKGLRLKDPAWSPNSNQKNPPIVAVINNLGTQNLVLINLPLSCLEGQNNFFIQPKDIIYLTHFTEGTQIYQPAWSPQGDVIAFSAWKDGQQDIYLLPLPKDYPDYKNLAPHPIFLDKATDLSPVWSADEQFLFFSSDRSYNIYNIFAYSLSEQKLYQITNVLGGAFQPAPSPDGKKLAYIEYHSTGYELHLMDLKIIPEYLIEMEIPEIVKLTTPTTSNNILEISMQTKTSPAPAVSLNSEDNLASLNSNSLTLYPIDDYSPFASFWPPTYWIPAARLSEKDLGLGFSTELTDILGFHSLPLTITYGLINHTLNYDFTYYYYHHYPILKLFFQGETNLHNSISSSIDSDSWWKNGKAGFNLYFQKQGEKSVFSSSTNSRSYQEIFSLGYEFEKDKVSSSLSLESQFQNEYQNIGSFKLSYTYSDTEKYSFSISPEQGQVFSLSYEYANKILGSDYNFHKILLDGRKFLSLPALHQVLALRLVAGYASPTLPEEEKYYLGGHLSTNNLSTTETSTFPLRGYKSSYLKGNNLILSSLEYRFPIANIEHSIKLGPLSFFLEKVSGLFFIDIGKAWENNQEERNNPLNLTSCWSEFKTGIGMELKADFNSKFDSPFSLRLGFAQALNAPKSRDIYFTLGTSF
ncbi:MAG: hypothetical protein Kow00103_10920 [Candidatus Caldatribacteriota bacterium]